MSKCAKKTTTQKQNYNEFLKLERNNTRKTNKNKHINQKNQTTLLTLTIELQGKQPFFLKQNLFRTKTKTQNKTFSKNKANITTKKQKG